jgi:hypothetical protein
MVIEFVEKSGFLGLKKHRELAPMRVTYPFIGSEKLETLSVVSENKIGIRKDINNKNIFLEIRYLKGRQINKAKLLIPREGKKPVRLRWRRE